MTTIRVRNIERQCLSNQWAMLESVSFDYLRSSGEWQAQRREIYHRGHGAALLLHNRSQRTVVLIRQFRFPDFHEGGSGFLLEVPAGVIEGDDPSATVRAEAEQETGYRIGTVQPLFSAYVSPGSVTERIHYFSAPYEAAQRVAPGGGVVAEGEDIEVLETAFDQALDGIDNGQICDAKTIILLQHAALHVFN